MDDKEKYIKRFKQLYEGKNNTVISEELALEYFEKLLVLVNAVYRPIKK